MVDVRERTGRWAAPKVLGRLLLGHVGRYRDGRLQDLATATLRADPASRSRVVSIVNATLAARRWLTGVVLLEPRRLVSRAQFARRARAATAGANRLSLLCPTRGRPDRLAALLRSLDRTVAIGHRVEVLCYADTDDPALPAYRALFDRAARRYPRLDRCVLEVGEPVGVPTAWNVLAAAATGDYLLMANDDQMYVDYGWDVSLDRTVAELAERHPDRVLCLYFDGGQYPAGGYDFPIVSRRWHDTLGYFVPTIFQQWSAEKWIFDLATRVDRLFPVPGVLVEHLHYQDYRAPFDATYQRHRLTREKSFSDQALFLRTEPDRARAADTLRRAMAEPAPHTPNGATVMTTTDQAPAPAGDEVGTRSYLLQMARRYYGNLIDAWHYGGRAEQARECADLAVAQGVWEHPLQRAREFLPGISATPVHDPAGFWFTGYLEEHYPQIRAEIEQVLDSAVDPVTPTVDDAALIRRGQWKQAHLFRDGRWQDAARFFPVTSAILAEIPEVTTLSPGVITVSRVLPGTHIMSHCGPTNAVLRTHLAITVPPGVSIRVADQVMAWTEGRCLVFDDSFEHEVWHEGSEDRVVLILDSLHPELAGDHQERLRQRRLTFEEQIVAFMQERGVERIEIRDGGLVFHPDATTQELATLYMAATGIVGAELTGDGVTWQRRGGDG